LLAAHTKPISGGGGRRIFREAFGVRTRYPTGMTNNRKLVTEYLAALSGKPKTPETVRRYVTDEGLIKHIADAEAAFPRYEIVAEDTLEDGDKVIVRGIFRGLHQGPFAGFEATGKPVSAGLIIIYRIENGRIVEHWLQMDFFGLVHQLQHSDREATA
jgi:predicted ester cyclase